MDLQQALDIVSYKIGLRFGEAALGDELFLDEKIHEAILDKASGNEQTVDLKQYMVATKVVSAERTRLFQVNNENFLTENLSQSDVNSTESGLQYQIIEDSNSSTKPSANDEVTVHYTGKLIDGMVFDCSIERGEPATFAVNKVIAGWTEGLQLMSVGSKYKFFIPQDLAYGDRGVGSDIPPFATLVFEVELISIN